MVCLFLWITKRIAILSRKTRIQLPKLCQSQLIRLYVQLQGNAMEHNGLFAGQKRKLETPGYIFFSREHSNSCLATAPNHPKTGTTVIFVLPCLPWEALCTAPRPKPRSRSEPEPRAPRGRRDTTTPKGWCAPPSPRAWWQGGAPRKLARPPRAGRGAELGRAEQNRPEPSRAEPAAAAPRPPRVTCALSRCGRPAARRGRGGGAGAARRRLRSAPHSRLRHGRAERASEEAEGGAQPPGLAAHLLGVSRGPGARRGRGPRPGTGGAAVGAAARLSGLGLGLQRGRISGGRSRQPWSPVFQRCTVWQSEFPWKYSETVNTPRARRCSGDALSVSAGAQGAAFCKGETRCESRDIARCEHRQAIAERWSELPLLRLEQSLAGFYPCCANTL